MPSRIEAKAARAIYLTVADGAMAAPAAEAPTPQFGRHHLINCSVFYIGSLPFRGLWAPSRGEVRLCRLGAQLLRAGRILDEGASMKIRNSLKSLRGRHRDNRLVRRKGRLYVINKTQKRFKARQG